MAHEVGPGYPLIDESRHLNPREVCRVKGGIGSGETLCHDIYPSRPITLFLWWLIPTALWTAIALAHLAP